MTMMIEPRWWIAKNMKSAINLNQVVHVSDNEDGFAEFHFVNGSQTTSTGSTRDFFTDLARQGAEASYTKQYLLTRFKAGFETSVIDKAHDYEMWRVNRSLTKDDELHLFLDDPLGTLGAVSSWSTHVFDIISDQILLKIGNLPVEVWLGDVKIKEAVE